MTKGTERVVHNKEKDRYERDGYDPIPRAEVVEALRDATYLDGGWLMHVFHRDLTFLANTSQMDSPSRMEGASQMGCSIENAKSLAMIAVMNHPYPLHVLIALSEFIPDKVFKVVNKRSRTLYFLSTHIVNCVCPSKSLGMLFMLGYAERVSFHKELLFADRIVGGPAESVTQQFIPPLFSLLLALMTAICKMRYVRNQSREKTEELVTVLRMLIRKGLKIDVFLLHNKFCDPSYRYMIPHVSPSNEKERWRENDAPHPIVNDKTVIHGDFALYLMDKITKNRCSSLSHKLTACILEARDNYVLSRSLFDRLFAYFEICEDPGAKNE